MAKAALVIMAAGLGSRYGGGIKQIEKVGPYGEILMDYAISDAMAAGFDKIVFIIRHDLETDFREVIGKRIEKVCDVSYAFQELEDLPDGFSLPTGRVKPWGTGHAILAAKPVIREPFAVINADDYYGRSAYGMLKKLLEEDSGCRAEAGRISMAAFVLGNTLSDNGGVTRGFLELDAGGRLTGVRETRNIVKTENGAAISSSSGFLPLDKNKLVSMNMWGLYPAFIDTLEEKFPLFLKDEKDILTREFLLPTIIDGMLKSGEAEVKVVRSEDRWFGMTYQEDRDLVRKEIAGLVEAGVYRAPLF